MENQKLESQLLLALNTSEPERERSENLNVGFDQTTRTWELIVKYNGNLDNIRKMGVDAEDLIAGYAILTVPEIQIEQIVENEQIEYVEKPKRLFFAQSEELDASCIPPVTQRQPFLSGRGVIVSVIDSGIDFTNVNFRNPDGSTRILALWDQSLGESDAYKPPEGFLQGGEFSREQIDAALRGELRIPSADTTGHGTAVAGIAAGSSEEYEGVAPGSELLIVKLGFPKADSFPRTTELMRALAYVVKKAQNLNRAVAINLSFGNTYGSHNGSSLLERFIDNIAEIGRNVICVGSGNEAYSAGHAQGNVESMEERRTILAMGDYEAALSVQLWTIAINSYKVALRSPAGEIREFPYDFTGKEVWEMENTRILVYAGEPTPYAVLSEIFFDFIPEGNYITPGEWTFILTVREAVSGSFSYYLPSRSIRSGRTGFLEPTPNVTLTIPSTASKVVTVGAYDSVYDAYADFSGRGYNYGRFTYNAAESSSLLNQNIKPDLVAPGVNVAAPERFGGYAGFTGTSFATPFVTGSAALMMEWGIVMGNDRFLYGEKVKAYLRRGARPIRGESIYPNERVGFGALCVADSLPL